MGKRHLRKHESHDEAHENPFVAQGFERLDAGGATAPDLLAAMGSAEMLHLLETPRPLIEFKRPSELKSFIPAPGTMLVGDCHVVRGSVFAIGGAPGVGKSRASVALAEAGATCSEWFGLTVHRQFKTMIIQTENGLFRLSKEFSQLDCDALENSVRISPPPPFGMCLEREDFVRNSPLRFGRFSRT